MFTGIIESMAEILEKSEKGLRLARPASFSDLVIGSSISVSGACLSVVEFDQDSMSFDVVPETFKRTKLGQLNKGDKVNLERALSASGRFEGHVVQGHIEGVGTVKKAEAGSLSISLPSELQSFVVEKGSITLDGVSLTVVSIKDSVCTVALIPHTLENSTLGSVKEGDGINVETDVLGKYVHSFLSHHA